MLVGINIGSGLSQLGSLKKAPGQGGRGSRSVVSIRSGDASNHIRPIRERNGQNLRYTVIIIGQITPLFSELRPSLGHSLCQQRAAHLKLLPVPCV